ncbi:AAA family ATPase [Chelatococcus reniformis]|uniref:AAA family ATPase n=1 Tax=Chelatococcus reniformis TaxID=1494448 RepID=UPI00166A7F77|nr:adenylate/guanylate cyclase domain-containing protein [Chelatococcus reniformis]
MLLLDIAGFVEMTNRMARHGPGGAEEVSILLNQCFGPLTDIIDRYGGDIIAFAGDAILAVWDDAFEMDEAARLAAQCALALKREMNERAGSAQKLHLRISTDIGEIHRCKLGGLYGQWCFVVVGSPFERLGDAYRKAKVGDVVLCSALHNVVRHHCEGIFSNGLFILDRMRKDILPSQMPAGQMPADLNIEELIPSFVVDHLRLGERTWLAEFRNVTIVYIQLVDLSFDETFAKILQAAVLEIQRVAHRFDGVVHKVLMDDKGFSIFLAFGVPRLAHEEDPQRGIEAGLAIARQLKAAGVRTSIGIASGKLFCGDYGGERRREYCLIGPAINIAARLMELAAGDILCDAATATAVRDRVSFSVLPPQQVKGIEPHVAAFRPVTVSTGSRDHGDSEIVGREDERRQLRDALQRGQGGAIIVQGEPGIGKSILLDDLAEFARAQKYRVLRGFATAIDKSTPYFAWRGVIHEILGGDSPEQTRRIAEERLKHDEMLASWLPLLREIINIDLTETALTSQITGSARAACLEALTIALLAEREQAPGALIFEDLHWFDSASIHLLAAVARKLPRLLLVASRRPAASAPARAGPADELGHGIEISLSAMSERAIEELIRRKLRASELPERLVKFVYQHSEGNPFHCEELALALRDTGAVAVARGVCEVLADLDDPAKRSLPASLEGAIVSRVDALPLETQLLLKAASAIGGTFTAETAIAVYPRKTALTDIKAMLRQLMEQDFLLMEDDGSAPRYSFRHAIGQEVTYRLLSLAQRVTLHKLIAVAIERQHSQWLEPYYSQLAQHWEHAAESDRAIGYFELAARQALRSHANRDAIRYIERAYGLTEGSRTVDNDARLSEWEEILGDANNELADYEEAFLHYGRAMAFLHQTSPRGPAGRLARVMTNVARQIRMRAWAPRLAGRPAVDLRTLQRTAHMRERLAERHFFLNESLAVLDETLSALNLAERCGATTEAVSGYSALGLGLGMSGLHRIGRFYCARALRVADEVDSLPVAARAHLLAAVFGYGMGDWDFTERCARRALSLYRQLGDRSRWHAPVTILAFSSIFRGDLGTAETLLSDLETMVSSESTRQAAAWHAAATALLNLMRGRTDTAQLRQLNDLSQVRMGRADRLLCLGILSSALLQRQETADAMEAAERGLAVLQEVDVVWGSYVYGVVGVTEVLLARWAEEKDGRNVGPAAQTRALLACRHAARATRMSPVCRPQALLLGGRSALLAGRPAKAQRLWNAAAQAAKELRMPRELGLALYQIGQTKSHDDPDRSSTLSRAADIFEGVGAQPDLAAVRRALSV